MLMGNTSSILLSENARTYCDGDGAIAVHGPDCGIQCYNCSKLTTWIGHSD